MPYLDALEILAKYSQHNEPPSTVDASVIGATIDLLSWRSAHNLSDDSHDTTGILYSLRALRLGIRHLPDNILTRILTWVLVGETYRLPGLTDKWGERNNAPGLRLERVCRRWRTIMICNLTPHVQINTLDQGAWRDACRLIERPGASAQRKDLCITIDGHPLEQPWRLETILHFFIRYGRRIVELRIRSSLNNLVQFLALPPVFSALRELRLTCLGTRDNLVFVVPRLADFAPNLEDFVFKHEGEGPFGGSCHCRERRLALALNPCRVRRLNLPLPEHRTAINALIKMLKESTSLVLCILRTYPRASQFRIRENIASSDDETAVIPSLRVLTVVFASTGEASFFLGRIVCPSLRMFRWSYNYKHRTAVDFFNRCGWNLTVLNLRYVTLNTPQLREVLVRQKNLVELVLDSITGLKTYALDGLEGAEILPYLERFRWFNINDRMLPTVTTFISSRCLGSPGRWGFNSLGDVTLGIIRRPSDIVLAKFLETKDVWMALGVKVSYFMPKPALTLARHI
ncbi:hypothetical protein C8R46DRAFT_1095594 [Mycena filopes]|nr:hypothetical protein C8R46DRAFT_1095594 [Mycena filopes]